MVVVESYAIAVVMCFVTRLCWGSWANTQKLATKEWRFQLFYWDYAVGVLLLSLIMAFTMGSIGTAGRSFLEDLGQASSSALAYAFIGGVVFNLANLLLVAAIDIAGMAVAMLRSTFPNCLANRSNRPDDFSCSVLILRSCSVCSGVFGFDQGAELAHHAEHFDHRLGLWVEAVFREIR